MRLTLAPSAFAARSTAASPVPPAAAVTNTVSLEIKKWSDVVLSLRTFRVIDIFMLAVNIVSLSVDHRCIAGSRCADR